MSVERPLPARPNRFCLESSSLGRVLSQGATEDFRLTDAFHAPDIRIGTHAHRFPTLTLVLDGEVHERIAGKDFEYGDFEVFFRNGGETHSDTIGSRGVRSVIIEVMAREVCGLSPEWSPVLRATSGAPAALALTLFTEFREAGTLSDLAVEEFCGEFLKEARWAEDAKGSGGASRRVRIAADFIRSSCHRNLRVQEIAAAAGVHPIYLARVFRRLRGCSLAAFVRRCRVERALPELKGGASVAEIALACGFFDQSHFCRTFRRTIGMSPSRYRATLRSWTRN